MFYILWQCNIIFTRTRQKCASACVCACVKSYAFPPFSFLELEPPPNLWSVSFSLSRSLHVSVLDQEEQECDWLDSIAQSTKASLLYRKGLPKYCVDSIVHSVQVCTPYLVSLS